MGTLVDQRAMARYETRYEARWSTSVRRTRRRHSYNLHPYGVLPFTVPRRKERTERALGMARSRQYDRSIVLDADRAPKKVRAPELHLVMSSAFLHFAAPAEPCRRHTPSKSWQTHPWLS